MIGVRYSCAHCGLDDIEVEVPSRDPRDDVVHWIKRVMTPLLVADHVRRSPQCRAQEFASVKIPLPPGWKHVGGDSVH